MNESQTNVAELTVSELSASLKRTVEDAYGFVRVRGEISGYKGPHSSGHCYFALKDEGAKIDAVIWKTAFARMRIKPEEGLEVVVTGRLTTYPNRSSYQIIVETLAPAGLGALMALLEERKRKLAAEGLFDEARKQLLPFLPTVIGVVTSPTGAVIRDILHRLADRFPRQVIVWPVKVQGDGSAEQVAAAINGFNALPEGGRIREARPDHRGARRRLAGGPVVVQRGDRGARRGRQHDPADLGGGPRDRRHADRFRRRPACADADGCGRDRGAGARGPHRGASEQGPPRARLLAARPGPPAHRIARGRPRPAGRRGSFWPCRGSGSIPAANGCRGRCAPTRRFITLSSRASPGGFRRSSCTSMWSAAALRLDACTRQLASALKTYRLTHLTRIARARDRVTAFAERADRAVWTLLDNRAARLERAGQLLTALFLPRRAVTRLRAGA